MTGLERVLVLGASGQLGTALVGALRRRGRAYLAPSRAELDLQAKVDVRKVLESLRPTAVINAASYNDVARAEQAEEHQAVFTLNRDVPKDLASACREMGLKFVHISTDYVFDGRSRVPYRENEDTAPLQIYGTSKLAGERAVLDEHHGALVARTSTLFGVSSRKSTNYVDAVVRAARRDGELSVVRLPVSSPTHARDVAVALIDLLMRDACGVVHVVNDGGCSRFELATETLSLCGLGDIVIREREPPTVPPERPAYSILDISRLTDLLGRPMPHWREALCLYIEERRL